MLASQPFINITIKQFHLQRKYCIFNASMNRIDRVTAILIQLQSRKVVKAQDIAERFKISLRTVYRDIKTLEEAGIPIIGEAGVGYSIMEGYRLPPVMFTKEEATAFITAEKLVEKLTDNSTDQSYKSAMFKVRSVLRSSEKDLLENIEENIEVMRNTYAPFSENPNDSTLQLILKNIADKKIIRIKYNAFNSDEITDRNIEPVGIFFASTYWYLIAFCRLRNDYRNFRTDRILTIKSLDDPFAKTHPSLKAYLQQVAEQKQLETVVIKVEKEIARYLQTQRYYYGFVSEKPVGDMTEMTFLTNKPDILLRWYMMFGDRAEIVSPVSLKEMLQSHIEKVTQRLAKY
jgi:predicted DNA-binding transcriptional regulator YafY